MAAEAPVWAEGRQEWQAVNTIPELQAAAAGDQLAGDTGAYTIKSRGETQAGKPAATTAVAAAAAPVLSASGEDAELAAFQAELAGIDPDAAAALGPATHTASTPPPEDQRFEDDDGTVYVWDVQLRKFVQEAAASLPEYNAEEMTFVPEEEKIPAMPRPAAEEEQEQEEQEEDADAGPADGDAPPTTAPAPAPDSAAAPPADQAGQQGARRGAKGPNAAADVIAKHAERSKRAREASEKKQSWHDLKVNTSVYVTGLPDDVTEAELAEVFTKCGVLKETDDRKPRVKVYRDKSLNVAKGDGLVTYLKEPSVDLACRILDGAQFRPGMGRAMTVQPAKFEMRGEEFIPRKKPAVSKRQKKALAQAEEKALGWGGFDDQQKPTEVTVILMHMFDPKELQAEPGSEKELEADVKAECERIGPVQKVRIFVNNPQGVMSVRFKTPEPAAECVQKMKGRFFGGRQLDAFMWDGITNYMVKKAKEQPEDDAARLEAFAESVEAS